MTATRGESNGASVVVSRQTVAVAKAQRLLCWAFLVAVCALLLAVLLRELAAYVFVGAVVVQFIAVARLSGALRHSPVLTAFYMFLMFAPLVALFVMLNLSSEASARLQAAGLTVGLMGVHPRDLKTRVPPAEVST